MTVHQMHNRSSAIGWMVLPPLKIGRDVLDIRHLCGSHVSQLSEYFHNERHAPLYNNIC